MQPVLDHLKPRLSAPDHALLTARFAALNLREKAANLDAFPAWREAAPQALE